MKAAVFYEPLDVRIEQIEMPVIKKDDVLVKVKSASLCGTDVQIFKGESVCKSPIVLGHDFSGEVADVGSKVHNLSVGDRICVQPVGYCGRCYYCRNGHQNLCAKGEWIGFERNGGFSEYALLKEYNILRISEGVSHDEAAIIEPVALGLRTLNLIQPQIGNIIAIIGQGPIGLVHTQICKLAGLTVIGIDLDLVKLELTKKYGADYVVNASEKARALSEILNLTSARGADVTIEASGTQSGVDMASEITRPGGKIGQVGHGKGLRGPSILLEKEFTIQYVELSPLEYDTALKLIGEKRIDVRSLISKKILLDELPENLNMIVDRKINPLKLIVNP